MSLSIVQAKKISNDLTLGIKSEISNGVKIDELADRQSAIYKNLLIESLVSIDKDEIFNHLSWLLFAGGMQNYNFIQAVEKLNFVINLLNNLPDIDREKILQKVDQFDKQNEARRLGGLKAKQKFINLKAKIQERYRSEKDRFSSKDEAAEIYVKEYGLVFSTIRSYLKNL